MFGCSTKLQPCWLQNVLKTLLQSVTFFLSESSSNLCVIAEMVSLVSGEFVAITLPKSTIFSATFRPDDEFLRSFVPT